MLSRTCISFIPRSSSCLGRIHPSMMQRARSSKSVLVAALCALAWLACIAQGQEVQELAGTRRGGATQTTNLRRRKDRNDCDELREMFIERGERNSKRLLYIMLQFLKAESRWRNSIPFQCYRLLCSQKTRTRIFFFRFFFFVSAFLSATKKGGGGGGGGGREDAQSLEQTTSRQEVTWLPRSLLIWFGVSRM